MTHLDYDGKVPKSRQRYRVYRAEGVTLGDVVDAVGEMFEKHADARFVMIESLRVGSDDAKVTLKLEDDRPTTKAHLPGSSAEREFGWY